MKQLHIAPLNVDSIRNELNNGVLDDLFLNNIHPTLVIYAKHTIYFQTNLIPDVLLNVVPMSPQPSRCSSYARE